MVMDVTPSPQCVGREFVRQYYTLLNEAPQYLHRFVTASFAARSRDWISFLKVMSHHFDFASNWQVVFT